MNERIKELYAKAHEQKPVIVLDPETYQPTHKIGNGGVPMYRSELNPEKFAELIVRECAKFCDEVIKEVEIAMAHCEMVKTSDRLMMLHEGTINGALMSKYRFNKHFGVE